MKPATNEKNKQQASQPRVRDPDQLRTERGCAVIMNGRKTGGWVFSERSSGYDRHPVDVSVAAELGINSRPT